MRIEDGEQIVEEIDRQNGWTSKRANFFAELVDLKIFFEGWICVITLGCVDGR